MMRGADRINGSGIMRALEWRRRLQTEMDDVLAVRGDAIGWLVTR